MYYSNNAFSPGAQGALGTAPSLPLPDPSLPIPPGPVPLEQPCFPTVVQHHRLKRNHVQPSIILYGSIKSDTLRIFPRGVVRFKLHGDGLDSAPVSCVMFRTDANKLPTEYLVRGGKLEVKGYFRTNEWNDKKGIQHKDTDFVVVSIQTH